jgi:hypothetical protein
VWKGNGGGKLEKQTQPEKEDNIINKWTQEDVNTLYSLLNNNNNNNNNNIKGNTCIIVGGGNNPRQKCAKGSRREFKIQEFMYRDTKNVEPKMYVYTSYDLNHWNNNEV